MTGVKNWISFITQPFFQFKVKSVAYPMASITAETKYFKKISKGGILMIIVDSLRAFG